MAQKFKVGIIGAGWIGAVHADAYNATGQAQVAAFADIDPAKLADKSKRFGVTDCFADYRKLLATDVDAVSICVPNAMHSKIAIDALAAGKHVLLEKPMALNAAQAEQIVAACKKARRTLQIGMCNRQRSDVQTLCQAIKDGMLGDIYHIRVSWIRRRGIPGLGGWFTTRGQSGGGPMIDLGVHVFDISMYVSGLWKPTSVSAVTYDKFGGKMRDYKFVGMWAGPPKYDGVFDVEDYSTGFVRFGRKATMNFDIAWACNAREDCYVEFLGTRGGARVMDDKPLQILTEQNGKIVDVMPQYKDESGDRFKIQAAKFINSCRTKTAPVVPGAQGVVAMKLIDAIYASSKAGKEVAIKA